MACCVPRHLGNNYVESPDGGCATLEYIPEILDLFLTTPTANGNDFGGNWQASWVNNGTPGMANSSAFGCNNPAACNFNPNAILGNEANANSTAATAAHTSRRTTSIPTRPSTMDRVNSPWKPNVPLT